MKIKFFINFHKIINNQDTCILMEQVYKLFKCQTRGLNLF